MGHWTSSTSYISMILLVFCLQAAYSQNPGCDKRDRGGLLLFRASLNDPNRFLESWGTNASCCSWRGIRCDFQSGRVHSLDVGGFSLSSTDRKLHPALFQLTKLKYLDLSLNSFHGVQLPSTISLLSGLSYLNLSNAGFAGVLPLRVGEISKLRYLDFSSLENLKVPSLTWLKNLTALEYISLRGVKLSLPLSEWGESVGNLRKLHHLDMTNCSLVGPIPASLRNLTSLTVLHMENNSISSEIPTWLFNMSRLVSLNLRFNLLNGTMPARLLLPSLARMDLSVNQLTGTIPPAIGNLRSLIYLDLGNNKFYGSIPSSLGNLCSLKFLRLRYNQLKSNIPNSLSRLQSLTYLDLSMDELNGTVPDSLGQILSLNTLFIWGNHFQGTVTESLFQNLTNLQNLILTDTGLTLNISRDWIPPFQLSLLLVRECNIGGSVPEWISHQTQLQHIDLSSNSLVGPIPLWLSNTSYKLQTFNISDNHLRGPIPSFAFQRQLTVMDLARNDFQGDIADYVGTNLPSSLIYLSLSNNQLTGSIPASISFLQKIEKLDLSNNQLKHAMPSSLGKCRSLNLLTMANNKLEGFIPEEMGSLKQLKSLDLSRNRLSGPIPGGLLNCKHLEILNLGKNNLTGRLPNWIASLKHLRVLVLRSNNLWGTIPCDIFRLPSLQIIDLASNNFSGVIPPEITDLTAMAAVQTSSETYGRYFIAYEMYYQEGVNITNKGNELDYTSIPSAFTVIDLSSNTLSGGIPVEIGQLKVLITLNLSNNQLSGPIPESLGAIQSLESLDLSCNRLNGAIPDTMQVLDFLGYLNLSYNNLSGRIPQQRHFDTFGASSFEGNAYLCGLPLNKTCPSQRLNPSEREKDSDGEGDETDVSIWQSEELVMGIGVGYFVGFAGVFILLWMSTRRRWTQIYSA